jgi:hypothetical protein
MPCIAFYEKYKIPLHRVLVPPGFSVATFPGFDQDVYIHYFRIHALGDESVLLYWLEFESYELGGRL